MTFNKYLIIIAGPTAIGKSSIAIDMATFLGTEIISADSRQVYRELNIGTAKISHKEQAMVPHHLIDLHKISDRFSAAEFEEAAMEVIAEVHSRSNFAILCGGTGLYIHAIRHGLDHIPDVPMSIRAHWDTIYQSDGLLPLQETLAKEDPVYFAKVDRKNHRRLIRALSVIQHTGKPYSSYLHDQPRSRPFEAIPILLHVERAKLYDRINQRVDEMITQGLEEEVRALIPYKQHSALQTVGYQEWFPYFEGQYDRNEAIRLIKRNSRRYAKRQNTWFKGHGPWLEMEPTAVMSWLQKWSEGMLTS